MSLFSMFEDNVSTAAGKDKNNFSRHFYSNSCALTKYQYFLFFKPGFLPLHQILYPHKNLCFQLLPGFIKPLFHI